MEIGLVVAIAIACILVGYLCGVFLEKRSEKFPGGPFGLLFVDKGESNVYSQFFIDPMSFENGQQVLMEICVLDLKSQQNQDT